MRVAEGENNQSETAAVTATSGGGTVSVSAQRPIGEILSPEESIDEKNKGK